MLIEIERWKQTTMCPILPVTTDWLIVCCCCYWFDVNSNCLVGKGLAVKISDVAAYRTLFARDYYYIDGRGSLPIRWMAPESLLWVSLCFNLYIMKFSYFTLGFSVLLYSVQIHKIPLAMIGLFDLLHKMHKLVYPIKNYALKNLILRTINHKKRF